MTIDILPNGTIALLWTDDLPLHDLGTLAVSRASNVEFNADAQTWEVRVPGAPAPLFTDPSRQACLDWEHTNDHVLLDHARPALLANAEAPPRGHPAAE